MTKKSILYFGLVALVALSVTFVILSVNQSIEAQSKSLRKAPEFSETDPQAWLNSPPLKLEDLAGKVLLIDFWTFECWNCYRSFPWLNDLEERFKEEDFQVIGIHTPEFEHEKIRSNIVKKIAEFKLQHAVMMDNDFTYWQLMRNHYWPTYYLIDKQGYIHSRFIGETHAGDKNARKIESTIRTLLALPG